MTLPLYGKTLFERRWAMWLSGNHRLTILSIIVITVMAAAFLATPKSSPEPVGTSKEPDAFGTVQEAFDTASREVKDLLVLDCNSVVIDPQFRSTFLSRSKIWSIKGYASCPDNQVYEWTVIMNYHDMHNWEVLAKTVTPLPDH
jgi:hypothetical protein